MGGPHDRAGYDFLKGQIPMATVQTSADIVRRMRRIRGRLGNEIQQYQREASQWLDWKHYVKQFPLASVASTALIAFWLAPGHRSTQKVKIDRSSIDAIADRAASIAEEPVAASKPTWLDSIISTASGIALQAAVGYVTDALRPAGKGGQY